MNTALHLLVFAVVGAIFPLLPLLLGRLLRPSEPSEEKDAIYECGEPTIGSSYIRFDLRFYVVALLFIVFDVELLFFFPWAVVFGRATTLADPALSDEARQAMTDTLLVTEPGTSTMLTAAEAAGYGWLAFADLMVFFCVLLVGYAYLWRMGDLDWVRSLRGQEDTSGTPAHVTQTSGTPAHVTQ